MNRQLTLTDAVWLDDNAYCSIQDLVDVSGLSIDEIEDLIGSGVITPAEPDAQPRSFHLRCVVIVKTARRLRDDFQLDRHGLALALTLLRRIEALETELRAVPIGG